MQPSSKPWSTAGVPPVSSPRVVAAGLLCLDVIPDLSPRAWQTAHQPSPGAVEAIGPVTLAIGGCVGNTGVALHRLGLRTTLVARVGDDAFGGILSGLVRAVVPGRDARLIATPGGATSYSVIESRPDADRVIRHFPGVNDRFVARDVPDDVLDGARLLHVGYPPLMAALIANDGLELERLFAAGHAAGAITSLDMAARVIDPGADRTRWRALLRRVLPAVDIFMPSLDEAAGLIGRDVRRYEGGAPEMADVARLADELLDLGAAIVGIKLGEHGLYLRTGSARRLATVPGQISPEWINREIYSGVFESRVQGTTGAGDATIAGFLHGVVLDSEPEACVTAACAVGGSSTEGVDGTSGIPAWPVIEARIADGWKRRDRSPGPRWRPTEQPGLWTGPADGPIHEDGPAA